MPSSPFESLRELLDQWADQRELSGSFLLTARGETVFEHTCGYSDRAALTPVAPQTRFGLASLTKMFTAVTVTDLVASGRLGFGARLVDLLPAARRPFTLLPEVTVHHLLCHTSGIADYYEEDEDSPHHVEDYGSLWDELPVYRMERPVDFLPLFAEKAPYRPPGATFQYSNAGYILLGLVIEEVTGQPFVDAVQSSVFDRAAMHDSGFFRFDEPVRNVAIGYMRGTPPAASWRSNIYRVPVVGGADGGAHCTARGLDRFLHAYSDGTLLGELNDTVLTPHADLGGGSGYGYGVWLYPDGRYGHDGGDPGVEVIVHRWPDADVHLVALCNMEGLLIEVRDQMMAAAEAAGLLGGHRSVR